MIQKLLITVEIIFIMLRLSRFYIICDTNTTEQRHGLELLIVKQLIKGYNGKILIDHSKYGRFKVALMIPNKFAF